MAIMGTRDTHDSVLSEVGMEPETVEEECGKDIEEGRAIKEA
jgi:hypothetical protein